MSTAVDTASGSGTARRAATPEFLAEIEQAGERFEGADPGEIISWSIDRFGKDIVLASSFQDAVLLDFAAKAAPEVEVLFLDTGYHFPETLAYMHHVEERYGLNLLIVEPDVALDVSPCGSADCCEVRKVAPLNRVLASRAAWITGLKRVDTPERADAPAVSYDHGRGVVKVNPLVTWTDDDIDDYVEAHAVPRHPLNYVGYISIGCAPTTRPVAPGENPRAGRWAGMDKTECGLHI